MTPSEAQRFLRHLKNNQPETILTVNTHYHQGKAKWEKIKKQYCPLYWTDATDYPDVQALMSPKDRDLMIVLTMETSPIDHSAKNDLKLFVEDFFVEQGLSEDDQEDYKIISAIRPEIEVQCDPLLTVFLHAIQQQLIWSV